MNERFDDESVKLAYASVDQATGLALQADSASAARELAGIPDGVLDAETATFRDAMIQRFGPDASAPPDFGVTEEWVAGLVKAYVNYWQQVLTKYVPFTAAEDELQAAVGKLMGRPLTSSDLFDSVETEIQAELTKYGFHALLGRTGSLRELMLWREQTTSQEDVKLPEGIHRVTIFYLNDFVLRGWGHYATCGRRSAGGWATEAGLFAVVPAYKKLDDETFSVRFLAHEAQHFADKKFFKHLEGWELEYRAKLVELALANTIQADTLKRICENRNNSTKQEPHPYANFMVIQDLEQSLANQPRQYALCAGIIGDEQAIRDAAKTLLIEDSRRRKKMPS